jgi:DNA ligase (NAD+)
MVNDQIVALNSLLLEAQRAYDAAEDCHMSDAEYDTKEAELRALVKAHPQFAHLATHLKSVGNVEGSRIPHVRPMLSIENKYTKEEIVEFAQKVGQVVVIEPKRDGISCELRYHNGTFQMALTRGDGVSGEDMTPQVRTLIESGHIVGSLTGFPETLHIRGELVMKNSELERINKEALSNGTKVYSSTRNLTAGTMKQKDLSVVASRKIEFLPWDIYSPTEDNKLPDSYFDRMLLLHKAGFIVEVYLGGLGQVLPSLDRVLESNKANDINADGVVIKVDSIAYRRELGVGSKFTNYQCCFKPQSASNTTTLRNVIWQVGRQGKLTPVAECDPVSLAGAMVTRASLNNISWIDSLGLKLGSKVRMLRSGDVIPQIVEVLDKEGEQIVAPPFCPECIKEITANTDSREGIITHWCLNVECPGRVRDTLAFIGSRDILEVEGLADDMAKRLASEGYARNIAELFEFQKEMLGQLGKLGEDKFASAMAKQGFNINIIKMLHSLEAAKTTGWDRWIAALGIPMIGRTLGKVLAVHLQLGADDMLRLPELFLRASGEDIEGMGSVKSNMLAEWCKDPSCHMTCRTLYDAGVRPTTLVTKTVNGAPLTGVAFVITGEFSEDRDSLTNKLISLGAVSKSGVSKNVNLLIVGDIAPGKSKLAKYDELVAKGVKIEKVGKEWLEKTLTENGIDFKGANCMVEEA